MYGGIDLASAADVNSTSISDPPSSASILCDYINSVAKHSPATLRYVPGYKEPRTTVSASPTAHLPPIVHFNQARIFMADLFQPLLSAYADRFVELRVQENYAQVVDDHFRSAARTLRRESARLMNGEMGLLGLLKSSYFDLIDQLLSLPPFDRPHPKTEGKPFELHFRLVGAGSSGQSDFELVLSFLNDKNELIEKVLLVIIVKTAIAVPMMSVISGGNPILMRDGTLPRPQEPLRQLTTELCRAQCRLGILTNFESALLYTCATQPSQHQSPLYVDYSTERASTWVSQSDRLAVAQLGLYLGAVLLALDYEGMGDIITTPSLHQTPVQPTGSASDGMIFSGVQLGSLLGDSDGDEDMRDEISDDQREGFNDHQAQIVIKTTGHSTTPIPPSSADRKIYLDQLGHTALFVNISNQDVLSRVKHLPKQPNLLSAPFIGPYLPDRPPLLKMIDLQTSRTIPDRAKTNSLSLNAYVSHGLVWDTFSATTSLSSSSSDKLVVKITNLSTFPETSQDLYVASREYAFGLILHELEMFRGPLASPRVAGIVPKFHGLAGSLQSVGLATDEDHHRGDPQQVWMMIMEDVGGELDRMTRSIYRVQEEILAIYRLLHNEIGITHGDVTWRHIRSQKRVTGYEKIRLIDFGRSKSKINMSAEDWREDCEYEMALVVELFRDLDE